MSDWDFYPATYRSIEVKKISEAVQAGECVSVVGLSGAGKSNLLGFVANRSSLAFPRSVWVDCNRLLTPSPEAFFQLLRRTMGQTQAAVYELDALESLLEQWMIQHPEGLCLLFDRFDSLPMGENGLYGNLRALRDAFKYKLTYVTSTRQPLDPQTELAELFFANTLWLGPMTELDSRWNIERYAQRRSVSWDDNTIRMILRLSGGYPSFLRAVCEACSSGVELDAKKLSEHPIVKRRLDEFWADQPDDDALKYSCLVGHPLLSTATASQTDLQLTAKEYLLVSYFRQHPGGVCEKDELIRAVWPEDKIFERGIRDDSLAQLIRRLREKIEPDPSGPSHIHTVPGRGYRYIP